MIFPFIAIFVTYLVIQQHYHTLLDLQNDPFHLKDQDYHHQTSLKTFSSNLNSFIETIIKVHLILIIITLPNFPISHQTLIIPFHVLNKSHHFRKVVHLENRQNSYSFILFSNEFQLVWG